MMVYVFEDGRVIYDADYLTDVDAGKYVEVQECPPIPPKEGMFGYYVANLETGKIEISYRKFEPEPIPPEPPEPVPEPTEDEILQAEMLLNQTTILENQTAQDAVLAEILLGQLGV